MDNISLLTSNAHSENTFYPTPDKLAGKMLSGIDWNCVETVLEPSAGKGDLAKCAVKAYKNNQRYNHRELDIDCIEIDRNLQHILRGEKFKVVHDDFITYRAVKRYDLILMNPPFDEGDWHLIKALEMQENGGKIVCLLNAETLLNPYTNTRRLLAQLLRRYKAEIQYQENEFVSAERKTNVKIALVRVNIPYKEKESTFYERMKKAAETDDPEIILNELAERDFVKAIISQYNVEVAASIELIKEYKALKPYIREDICDKASAILTLTVGRDSNYSQVCDINKYLKKVRLKYWQALFSNREFTNCLTSNLQAKYRASVDKMADYDFTLFNIQTIITEMNAELTKGIEDTIISLFDELSAKHSWYPECDKNVHYFNGWASNRAHKVNSKVIIPTNGMFSSYSWRRGAFEVSNAMRVLHDIEKALNYLDGGLTAEVDLRQVLEMTSSGGQTRNIPCKYFDVDLYKKGTMHIKFKNQDLLDKLNIYAARNRNWLPPNYGRTHYSDMDIEAKQAVDEFQGEAAYEKVVANNGYYLFEAAGSMPMLTAAV